MPKRLPGSIVALVLLWPAASATGAGGAAERRTANDGQVVLENVPEMAPELVARLNRYQNVRSASFEDWTGDGTGLYIRTRFGDVTQIHHVARPGGARRQLTFFPEPTGGASRRPSGAELAFTMDEGGSEFYQVFLLDPRTGDARRLTDGESRNGFVRWSPDGTRIACTSTRRNGRSNDVWLLEIADPAGARLVVEAPDGSSWAAADWSADGGRLLIQQYVSSTDSRVHLLDLASGERTRLLGGEPAPSSNLALEFDAGDTGLFVVTDRGDDFRRLAHLDLASGEVDVITRDIPWDVNEFELSEDGRRAAFVVNEGGVSRLYLMDAQKLVYAPVETPAGLVDGLGFSPDGSRLAMTLNTARTASDVYTIELGAGATDAEELVRWTESEVGGLDTESFALPELVYFPTFDEVDGAPREIPAFVYRPEGAGPHPVIVSIHGGPEGQARPGFSSTYQAWIAELGAAVVVPNVRGSSGYGRDYLLLDNGTKREDPVRDIGALLDWIARAPDLDERRVAVYGGSYGGYMVLASMVRYSDRLRAGVDIVGISNFVTFLESTQDYRRDLRRVEYGDERDAEMRAFLESISPNRQADRITAPLFVAQGQNDPRVPVTESEQIVRNVRAAGYDVWYMNCLNEGHGFKKKENRDLYEQVVVTFLEKHLLR